MHIRPPQCLSALQQRLHCQKTQKQAVSYRRRSHGNRPAEGAPAQTLICTDSPLPDSSAEWWWGSLAGRPAYQRERLVVQSATRGTEQSQEIPGTVTMMWVGLHSPPLPRLDQAHLN